jgi:hypothetical protein
MDPSLLWLRRHVLARAAERAAIETVIAAGLVAGALVGSGVTPIDAASVAIPAGPLLIAVRLVAALATNPVGHRFLSAWTDPTEHLEVVSRAAEDEPGVDRAGLDDLGFRFVLGLARSDEPRGEDGGIRDRLDLYRGGGGRVLLACGAAGESTVLSRLSDGRLLVTSSELVPPRCELAVNHVAPGPVDHLVGAHGRRLVELGAAGVDTRATWPDSMVELLGLEWDAWSRLGPLVGPLLGLERRRWPSARFEVRIDPDLVWARSRRSVPDTNRPGRGLPGLAEARREGAVPSTVSGR